MITKRILRPTKKLSAHQFWWFATCLIIPFATQAASTNTIPPLTVDKAVELSLVHLPQLRMATARLDAAQGRLLQSGRWENPELELKTEEWPLGAGGRFGDAKHTIGISQTVPYPGKKRWDRQIAIAGVHVEAVQLTMVQTEVEKHIRTAFCKALAASNMLLVSAELLALAETSSTTVRRQLEAGAATRQDLLRVELYEEQTRAEHAGFQNDYIAARQALATLLPDPHWQHAPLAGSLQERAAEELLQTPFDQALARHPALMAAQFAEKQAQHTRRRAQLETYPDLQVSLAGGRAGADGEAILELGLTLPLPLWDRGRGRQMEAEALTRAAAAEVTLIRQELHRSWLAARQRYRTAAEQVLLHRERILTKAEAALKAVQTGHQEGKLTFLDLLDTQRTVAQARLAYQQKLLELNLAHIELQTLLSPHYLPANSRNSR